MAYTDKAQIEQGLARLEKARAEIGERRVADPGGMELQLTHRMDSGLAYHAFQMGEDPFNDEGYREDMVRRGCVIKVEPKSGKTQVSLATGRKIDVPRGARAVMPCKNRFGRGVKIVYG